MGLLRYRGDRISTRLICLNAPIRPCRDNLGKLTSARCCEGVVLCEQAV